MTRRRNLATAVGVDQFGLPLERCGLLEQLESALDLWVALGADAGLLGLVPLDPRHLGAQAQRQFLTGRLELAHRVLEFPLVEEALELLQHFVVDLEVLFQVGVT